MDSHKLKLDKYENIKVLNLPGGVELPFETAENNFQCLIAFVQSEAQVDSAIAEVKKAGSGTALILAYPKGTSKRYKAEVNRDSIAAKVLATPNFGAPRLVSLDQDWSGFSFKYK